jgi:hypothetical protein
MQLVWPSREYLARYVDALERGWSPDNVRGLAAGREELDAIGINADLFLASLVDRESMGSDHPAIPWQQIAASVSGTPGRRLTLQDFHLPPF